MRLRRFVLPVLATAAALVLTTGVASASTATTSGATLVYTAASGEANEVEATASGVNAVTLTDLGADITPSGNCSYPDATDHSTVDCTGVGAGSATLGYMDDFFDASSLSTGSITVDGGPGDDSIFTGGGADTLQGGAGFDDLEPG